MPVRVWKDSDKFRYFQFEYYEESAPINALDILKESKFEYAVSPWHSQDVKDDGSLKKNHRHVIFHTPGNSPWTVKRATEFLNATGVPANGYIEPVFHPRNAQRYLIHLDNPDKMQFDKGIAEIEVLNGFPLDLTRDLSTEEKRQVRKRIFELIRSYNISEYSDLIDSLLDGYGDVDMIDYACNHTILFNSYLSSKRNSSK